MFVCYDADVESGQDRDATAQAAAEAAYAVKAKHRQGGRGSAK
jgi:hypothetical protein